MFTLSVFERNGSRLDRAANRISNTADQVELVGELEGLNSYTQPTDYLVPYAFGFYGSPNEAVDPRDCDRWPDSPWCDGGSGAGGDILSLDFDIDISLNGCDALVVTINPSVAYLALPPLTVAWRRPSCRRPLEPYREQEEPEVTPLPERPNDNPYAIDFSRFNPSNVPICRFVFSGYYENNEYNAFGLPVKKGINPQWRTIFSLLPFSDPFSIVENTRPFSMPLGYGLLMFGTQNSSPHYLSDKKVSFWEAWQRAFPGVDREVYGQNNPTSVVNRLLNGYELPGWSFFFNEFFATQPGTGIAYVAAGQNAYAITDYQEWKVLDVTHRPNLRGFLTDGWYSQLSRAEKPLTAWSIEEIQYHADRGLAPFNLVQGFQLIVSSCHGYPVQPAPPPINFADDNYGGPPMTCNCQDIEDMVRAIYKVVDPTAYPVKMPKAIFEGGNAPLDIALDFITPDQIDPNYTDLETWPEWFAWWVKQVDGLMGEFPIEFDIKDTDPITRGDQRKRVSLPNLAEALAELFGLMFKGNIDGDVTQQIALRMIPEVINVKTSAIVTQDYVRAIAEYLGFRTKQKQRRVPFAFNPKPADNLVQLFEEKDLIVMGLDEDDQHTLIEHVQKLLFAAEIIKAALLVTRAKGFENLAGNMEDVIKMADDEDFIKWLRHINRDTGVYSTGYNPTPSVVETRTPTAWQTDAEAEEARARAQSPQTPEP